MQKCIDLTDKVAVVTGGSSGIGWASAVALAKAGARLSINYFRNEAGAEDARNSIVKDGGTAITVRADVTQNNDVEALIKRTTQELGPIDILINNAGSLVQRLRILELTEERWDEVIDLNLKSVFLCSRAVAASMMERKKGNIINVSSIAGRTGGALGSLHYSAAKAGVIALTKGLAKELGPFGVRVNAVSPGVIDTPFHEQFSTPEMMKGYVSSIPLGRVGTSEEIGNVIAFLASDDASFITGETIEINGGMLML